MTAEAKETAHAYLKERFASALANRRQLVGFFLRNAQAKHGVPHDDGVLDAVAISAMLTTPLPKAKPMSQAPKRDASNTTIHMRAAPPNPDAHPPARTCTAPKQSSLPRWLPWVIAAAIGGAGLLYGLTRSAPPAAGTVVNVPPNPPAPSIELPPESPLIFLDERGLNQP